MKSILSFAAVALAMAGCAGTKTDTNSEIGLPNNQIGMSEKAWQRRTLIAYPASLNATERVWVSNGAYYHFVNGRLARVEAGRGAGERSDATGGSASLQTPPASR